MNDRKSMKRNKIIDFDSEYAGPFTVFKDEEGSEIIVYQQCQECGRFIKSGELLENGIGDIKLIGWICKKCGEVKPFYVRI